ncbi:MAG: D-alanyl-D-alanine carboxypeptidase/D-alanyl-D-alanine-endopeptidase [Candidatus Delongbacteria bacterium]|jgi:D-alanyl-D-alanine carboxypeptidase/D-alanyl-D-alanine-endopeptidase (penicillin-binding protein 4)|nr:D-alanyl-D-alanine carboxypeptidase/D-alanyl-D-alanine-endopeptidase [Candidatus Delongbacteria bacterium]
MNTTRLLIIASLLFTYTGTFSQALDIVPELQTAGVSYIVMDARTGKTLDAHREHVSMTPASTMKIVATAAAMDKFGPEHCFETSLAIRKQTEDGVLHGDVYILGGGDPALGAIRFKNHYYTPFSFLKRWSDAIEEAGIQEIDGNIVGSENQDLLNKIPRTWIWEDIANYYGASPSLLNIYENTYQLSFDTGNKAGDATKINKITPADLEIEFQNEVKAADGGGDQAYIFGIPGTKQRIVRGTLPAGYNKYIIKGAIPNPALLAAKHLKDELVKNGINVSGNATTGMPSSKTETIHTLESPPLQDLIKLTHYKSINLYANMIGLLFSEKRIMDEALQNLISYWNEKGLRTEGMALEDACGLSGFNQVSAYQMAYILKYMSDSKYADQFKKSLPVSGESGTLKYFGRNYDFQSKFHGKSGSIKRVNCYAGYLETKSGKEVIVVSMINRYADESGNIRNIQENFFEDVFSRY